MLRSRAGEGWGDCGMEVEQDVQLTEERQILLWRLVQFSQLGFEYAEAIVLAEARVDLGEARRLVASGCPLDTASRILL